MPPSVPCSIPIIGFSATFSRHDGLALGSVFEKIVYHRDFLDMIKEQWQAYPHLMRASQSQTKHRLCDVRFTSVKASINLQGVTLNSRTGDFNPSGLAQIINTETINNLVARAWLDRACTYSERQNRQYSLILISAFHLQQLTASRPWCFASMSPMLYSSQKFFESSELMLAIYTPIHRHVSGEH